MVKDRKIAESVAEKPRGSRIDIAAAVLSYVGLVVASTVWWADRLNIDLPCTASGGCEQVANSAYSHLHWAGLDIPVALLGVAGYLLLFTLSIASLGASGSRRLIAYCAAAISAGGTAYSWYLQYIAHFKIGAFCPWCFTSACLMTVLCAVLLGGLRSSTADPAVEARGKRMREAMSRRRLALAGVWLIPMILLPLLVSVLAVRRAAPALAAPAIGRAVSPSTPGEPTSQPTQIVIDFPTWVKILQHTDSQIRGPMRTPYTLVEIGDFQCPTCAKVRTSLEQVVDTAKVNMFFINDPLPIHKWSVPAAEAAFAAAAQGKFWPMYDALYTHQSDLEPRNYGKYASAAGLDGTRLAAEVAAHKYLPQVKNSEEFCNSIKVSGTPTLIVHNNMTGDAFVAVGSAQIATAVATTDWHSYDTMDLDHPDAAPASAPSKKKHVKS